MNNFKICQYQILYQLLYLVFLIRTSTFPRGLPSFDDFSDTADLDRSCDIEIQTIWKFQF